MPGIVGIIGPAVDGECRATVLAMLKTMAHAPWFTSGVHIEERLGVAVGWTAHPGSFGDGMPVWNEARDVGLVLSGEDFGHDEELERSRANGRGVLRHPAGYLVRMYEATGPGFLDRINGWFSGVLLDLRAREVLLFNDRYGINRLFYHESKGAVYFASEAKALLKVLPGLRRLDVRSLGEFLSLGCVLQHRTLFTGVTSIPGASVWTFRPGGSMSKARYFSQDSWENQMPLSAGEYYESLKATWARIVPKYFRGQEQVGLSLTGGVDSRMVLAWAPSASGSFPCYTWGGEYRESADVKLSRQIAKRCGQSHQTIPVGRAFMRAFPEILERSVYISDGTMDAAGAIDLYVQQLARQIAPVRVGGVYGGEMLRGLVAFKPTLSFAGWLEGDASAAVVEAAETYAEERRGNHLSFVAFKQAPWYMTSKFAIERSAVTCRTPYFDNELVRLVYQAPAESAASNDVSLRLIVDGNPALHDVGTDRGLSHRSIPLLTPLRHCWQEFTFRAEYAYDYGMPQWLATADHLLAPLHLERLFLGRHKFHHFRIWYRDALAGYLRDVLLDRRALQRPYLRRSTLERMVHGHTSGRNNFTLELHRILACELIQRQLVDVA